MWATFSIAIGQLLLNLYYFSFSLCRRKRYCPIKPLSSCNNVLIELGIIKPSRGLGNGIQPHQICSLNCHPYERGCQLGVYCHTIFSKASIFHFNFNQIFTIQTIVKSLKLRIVCYAPNKTSAKEA